LQKRGMRIQIAHFLERHRALAILMLFVLQFVNGAISTHSIFDRREMKKTAELSRQMLDVRARMQIIVIERNWDRFTPEERRFIEQNWTAAEYDQALPLEK
jgi:hypothetical protein